jgi:hypothetical protein
MRLQPGSAVGKASPAGSGGLCVLRRLRRSPHSGRGTRSKTHSPPDPKPPQTLASEKGISPSCASKQCTAPHPAPAPPVVPRETLPRPQTAQPSHPPGACPSSPSRHPALPMRLADQFVKSTNEAKARELTTSYLSVKDSTRACTPTQVGQLQTHSHLLNEGRLLAHRIHTVHSTMSGQQIAMTTPGKPAPEPTSSKRTGVALPASCLRSGAMTARLSSTWCVSISAWIAHSSQVIDLVPLLNQIQIRQKRRDLLGLQIKTQPRQRLAPAPAVGQQYYPIPSCRNPINCLLGGTPHKAPKVALLQVNQQQ